MRNNRPRVILLAIGLFLMLFSILLRAKQINLPFFVCMMWFFFGIIPIAIIVNKILKIKSEDTAATIIVILYLFGLTATLHWYNPHYIVMGLVLCIAGAALNAIVTKANHGKMPVCIFQENIIDTHIYVAMKKAGPNKTKLNVLGDWIPSPAKYLSSPGDYLMEMGPILTAAEIFFFF